MILVDVNLLVYATVTASPDHERARTWLDEQLSSESVNLSEARPVGV